MAEPILEVEEFDPLAPDFDARAKGAGAEILDRVRSFIRRFCAFPDEHSLDAVTLWAVHAHFAECFSTTPRLAILSPEPGSGKTRVLEILSLLTPNAMFSISASPAAILRLLKEGPMTLLFDEVDAIFNKRGPDSGNEDLRALLNAGYRRGAIIPRCVGPTHKVERFPVFCPVALAGLGDLPDTIMSRSIIIKMRRRGPGEIVEPYRSRDHDPVGREICDGLALWAEVVCGQVRDVRSNLPEGVVDRDADVWEPLIAIADAAGGDWPDRARGACTALIAGARQTPQSLGVRLLSDLRTIFEDERLLPTREILKRLKDAASSVLDADAPWEDFNHVGLNERSLAQMLKPYGVFSKKIKAGGVALQGYRREDLIDAWRRYLPPASQETELPELAEPPTNGSEVASRLVPRVPAVPDFEGQGGACLNCDSEGCSWCEASKTHYPKKEN